MTNAESNEIRALQSKYQEINAGNSVIYTEIGKIYYQNNSENPAPEFVEQFQKIKASLDQMKQIDKRIKFLNGIVVCDNCNMENNVNASFCSGCGTRLPHTFVSDGANRCPNCGGIITKGQRFCGTCGASTASVNEENAGGEEASATVETLVEDVVVAPVEETVEKIVEEIPVETPVILPVEEIAPSKSFCPNCGAEVLESDSVFCAECGCKLD